MNYDDIGMIVLLLLSIAVIARGIVDLCIDDKNKKNTKSDNDYTILDSVAHGSVVDNVDDLEAYTKYLDRVGIDYEIIRIYSVASALTYDVVYEICNDMTEIDSYHHTYFDYNGDFMLDKINDRELNTEDYDDQYSID